VPGRMMCERCLSNARDGMRRKRKADKAAGINNHWYVRRKASGVCTHCGEAPPVNETALCGRCSEAEWGRRIRVKNEVVQKYGGKCACPGCSESNVMFLSIDHIEGGGTAERAKTQVMGGRLYKFLKRKPVDPGLQVLCYNCNFAKGNRDLCPHQYMDRVEEALKWVSKSVVKRNRK